MQSITATDDNTDTPAAALGRKGGQVKSEAKAKAVRENGKKGWDQTESKYYIGSNGSDYWTETNAKSINGAKALASKTYQQAAGGCIMVGEEITHPNGEKEIVKVALKYGYDKWRSEY